MQCSNITSAGGIGSNQVYCGPTDPSVLTSSQLASGGTGAISYQWAYSTSTNVYGNLGEWNLIPDATASTYDPPTQSTTRYYVRLARTATCGEWLPSNVVTVVINPANHALETSSNCPVCPGDQITFNSTVYTYGNNLISNADFSNTSTLGFFQMHHLLRLRIRPTARVIAIVIALQLCQ
ncbi:MAG: hypothetical protein HC817_05705 [Saprospiraceae bacterium]|nr:hypothetical protein [Saprospiraceae bacterium]